MNLHPMLVHFPVAVSVIAFIFEVLDFLTKGKFKNTTLLFISIVVLSSIFAVQSGNIESQRLKLSGEEFKVLAEHQESATYSLFVFGIVFMLKLYVFLKIRKVPSFLVFVLFFLYLVGLFFIFKTAYLGAELVFKFGVASKQS
jgi:uncharacterized membrane protein